MNWKNQNERLFYQDKSVSCKKKQKTFEYTGAMNWKNQNERLFYQDKSVSCLV